LLPLCGCRSPRVTPQECTALLDRYVEQLLRRDDPDASPSLIEKKQAEARQKAASHHDFLRCPERVSHEEMQCALHSANADATERCLVPIPLPQIAVNFLAKTEQLSLVYSASCSRGLEGLAGRGTSLHDVCMVPGRPWSVFALSRLVAGGGKPARELRLRANR